VALYIFPSFQGQGLGSWLLNHMETISRKTGVKRLWARVSLCSREFYKKNKHTILDQRTYLGIRYYSTEKCLEAEDILKAR
jgi:GNAT superfamily N-acetyltransferase